VIDRDLHDIVVASHLRALVRGKLVGGAEGEAAAVDVEHHGTSARQTGRPDVQLQHVLALRAVIQVLDDGLLRAGSRCGEFAGSWHHRPAPDTRPTTACIESASRTGPPAVRLQCFFTFMIISPMPSGFWTVLSAAPVKGFQAASTSLWITPTRDRPLVYTSNHAPPPQRTSMAATIKAAVQPNFMAIQGVSEELIAPLIWHPMFIVPDTAPAEEPPISALTDQKELCDRYNVPAPPANIRCCRLLPWRLLRRWEVGPVTA
jgi:hypothetical protein